MVCDLKCLIFMKRNKGMTPSRTKLVLRRSELGRQREGSFLMFKEKCAVL